MFSSIINIYALIYKNIVTIVGSYGLGIIILSLLSSVILLPLVRLANKLIKKEQEFQDVIHPQVKKIKAEATKTELHNRIQCLYQRYGYHPIYAIRKLSVLFIQLPFLIITYYMLIDFKKLSGQPFLFIQNLGAPDALLWGINLLPISMTLINIISAITMKGTKKNDFYQAVGFSIFFLIILYKIDASLLLYWNMNNLILLIKNIYSIMTSNSKIIKGNKNLFNNLKKDIIQIKIFLKTKITLEQLFIFSAFIFLILSIQETCYFLSLGTWQQKWSKQLLFYSSISLFCTSIVIIKKHHQRYIFQTLALFFALFIPYALRTSTSPNFNQYINILSIVMIMIAIILAYIFFPKDKTFNTKQFFILSTLAILSGLTFHWNNNSDLLYSSTIGLYFCLGIIFMLICCISILPYVKALPQLLPWEISGAVFLFVFIMFPTARSILIWEKPLGEYTVYLTTSFLLFTLLLKRHRLILYIMFSTLIILNIGLELFGISFLKKNQLTNNSKIEKRLKSVLPLLPQIKQRPNIYLLVSESTPDLKTLEELGVNTSYFRTLLSTHKFKIYDSTYSLGSASIRSMSQTFDIKRITNDSHKILRPIVGGESLVNQWLQKLGYKTAIIAHSYLTGPNNSYNFRYPSSNPTASADNDIKFDYLLVLLKGIGMREFKFNIVGLTKNFDYEKAKHDIIKKNKKEPYFLYYHSHYPMHSQNSGKCLKNELDKYIKSFNIAMKNLQKDLILIEQYDPNAIVIIVGDHGPYLTGDCLVLKNYKPQDITELMIRDRLGTIMAIRWPDKVKAKKYDKELIINQNIFPVIFAYLYDSSLPLTLKIKSKITFAGRTLDNGKFVPLN